MGVNVTAIYENIPIGSREGSTTNITYPDAFVNFNNFKSRNNVPKYATLEQGRNLLDGTFINFPENPQGYGYLSTILTDSNGNLADDIVITRTYNMNYTSPRSIHRI